MNTQPDRLIVAGALLEPLDSDRAWICPALRPKLEAIIFAVFVPVFFVVTGVQFNLDARVAGRAATCAGVVI
jgi:Kef-type K+ transport system membrane component KefB